MTSPERELRELIAEVFGSEGITESDVQRIMLFARKLLAAAPAPTPAPPTLEQQKYNSVCDRCGGVNEECTCRPAEPAVPEREPQHRLLAAQWLMRHDLRPGWHSQPCKGCEELTDSLAELLTSVAAAPRAAGGEREVKGVIAELRHVAGHEITKPLKIHIEALQICMEQQADKLESVLVPAPSFLASGGGEEMRSSPIMLLLICLLPTLNGCMSHKPKAAVQTQPNLAASGVPCKEYGPLPAGWVCDEERQILLCAPGWRPFGLNHCVQEKAASETCDFRLQSCIREGEQISTTWGGSTPNICYVRSGDNLIPDVCQPNHRHVEPLKTK